MSKVILSRLLEYVNQDYDPWCVGFSLDLVKQARKPNLECFDTSSRNWTADQHAQRIVALTQNQTWLYDPIEVDNVCDRGRIFPVPLIINGWHRFFAHVLKKEHHINVNYGGRVDLLDYLSGRTGEKPEW